jgi:hypothetical protein
MNYAFEVTRVLITDSSDRPTVVEDASAKATMGRETVIRSVELIVQPDAHDVAGSCLLLACAAPAKPGAKV